MPTCNRIRFYIGDGGVLSVAVAIRRLCHVILDYPVRVFVDVFKVEEI